MHPVLEGDVGYHIRTGGHSVELYDWRRILDFADRHLKPRRPAERAAAR